VENFGFVAVLNSTSNLLVVRHTELSFSKRYLG